MLVTAIQARRQTGQLDAWLNRSGLTWYRGADYPGHLPTDAWYDVGTVVLAA